MKRLALRIADGEILVAPLVALLLTFPTRAPALTGAGLVALVGVWLVRWWARGSPLQSTPLNLALLSLLLTVPVAAWASAVWDLTTVALAYLLAGFVLFRAVVHWTRTPGRAWWIWGGLVSLGLGLALLAPLAMRSPRSKLFPLPALYSHWTGRLPETVNANVLAGALVLLWPVALAGIQFSGQQRATRTTHHASRITFYVLRTGAVLSALLLLATLILAQSRGAYLGAVVSLVVWLSLRWPRAAWVVVPLALVVALVGASLVGWGRLADELMTGEATSGLGDRAEIWSRALYAIQDFPYTGLGLGTFERVVALFYPLFLNPEGTVPHAHNLYLQVAVDLGLPGLVGYLALLGLTFASAFCAYRRFREKGRPALAGLCAGCIAGLAGMCTHGLVDAVTWGLKLAFIPWAVMGLVVGLHGVAQERGGGEGGRGKREEREGGRGKGEGEKGTDVGGV